MLALIIQVMFAVWGCLKSYTLTKFLCSFCTEVDILNLKYLARYMASISIFDCIIMPTTFRLGLLLDLLEFLAGVCRSSHWSCSSNLLAAYKPNETGKLLTFERDYFKVQLYIF